MADKKHVCNAECWAYMLRYEVPEECDPFAARDAAEREAYAEGVLF